MTLFFANAGIPMIVLQLPAMICALIPVIILESLLIRRWLSLPYGKTFKGVTIANLASTIVGVPLAWLVMFIIGAGILAPAARVVHHWDLRIDSPILDVLGFVLGIAWLAPVEDQLYWMVPAASALLLIPSFFVSLWIERYIYLRLWRSVDPSLVRRGVLNTNLASYGLLFLIACGWLAIEYLTKR